ncbi:hypothetical protein N665_0688s0010 [Sinapis alba]|nr:hypothetical protein N665_0688s0010 [Sinapis alba]
MELELGLKITRTREDVSSSTDFSVSRDSFGQRLRLKWNAGFKKKGVDIEISEDGDRITISGRKKVEEMVLVKWVEWKKETEIQEFKKVFRIPRIVNLDKIKARFNEEDETLTVTFPKKVKGITGLKIEEEEETEEKTEPEAEKTEEIAEQEEEIKEEAKPEEEEAEEPKMEEEEDKIEEEVVEEEEIKDHEEETEEKESKPKKKKRKKFCFPCVAGSTLLMSIIVFIIQLIQSRRK